MARHSSPSTPAARLVVPFVAFALLLSAWKIYDILASQPSVLFQPLQEVRWGLIGCGDVTEKKSGPAFSKAPHSKLVIVMRRNATLAADYARRHNVPRWTSNAQELIEDPEVNAIYIATPPRYHAQYAIAAARAGKPAYVEKPMGMSYEDSRAVVQKFRSARLPLYVAYYRRYLPNFLRIKQIIESGSIGDVRAVHVQYHRPPSKHDLAWALNPKPSTPSSSSSSSPSSSSSSGGDMDPHDQQGLPRHHPAGASLRNATLRWRTDPLVGGLGGYFRDKGSHQLDLLDHWFGPIVAVSGWSTNLAGLYPSPDTVVAHFRFGNGIAGTGSWSFVASKAGQQEFGEISGSKGRIKFQFFLSSKVEVWGEEGYKEYNDPTPAHVQQPIITAVVAALRGEGECVSTGESALRTSLILDRIVQGEQWA